jgi:hypothetical protein
MGHTSECTMYQGPYVMDSTGNSISFPVGLKVYALSLQKTNYSNTPVFLFL